MTSPCPHAADIRRIVAAGLLAPSGDNCQPWRFTWDGSLLEIHFDRERAASLYDVNHTASWVSLGAALTNLRIAARSLGWQLDVRLFPQGPSADVVAQLHLEPAARQDDPLNAALIQRCVNRRAYSPQPLDPTLRARLRELAAAVDGVSLEIVEDPATKAAVARLAARNDRILFENRALHDGLFRWLRWTPQQVAHTADGMPIGSLELHAVERAGFRAMASWRWAQLLAALGLTRLLPQRACDVYRRSAAIALLSIAGRRAEDFVRGGECLEMIWLTATAHGLAFQPITGIICLLLRLRLQHGEGLAAAHCALLAQAGCDLERIFHALRQASPIMLFRLGKANPPSQRALRRPVETVLSVSSSAAALTK